MLPHLLDFVYIGALVAPILSGAIGSINDATTCAQLGEILAGFGKRRRRQLDDDTPSFGATDGEVEIRLGRDVVIGGRRGIQGENLIIDCIETVDVAIMPPTLQVPSSPSLPVFLQPTVTSSTLGTSGQRSMRLVLVVLRGTGCSKRQRNCGLQRSGRRCKGRVHHLPKKGGVTPHGGSSGGGRWCHLLDSTHMYMYVFGVGSFY